MRMVIKGADFSSVSIGKVVKDLSFRLCGNKADGVSGFPNWNPTTQLPDGIQVYKIDSTGVNPVVALDSATNTPRLKSDYIEVTPGMTIYPGNEWTHLTNINGETKIMAGIVCFDAQKNLLTDASLYSVYRNAGDGSSTSRGAGAPFVVPEGVKYVIIQCTVTASTEQNIITGVMPTV